MAAVADLTEELRTLRKGRGVDTTQVGDRLGPALREVCGVEESTHPAEARRRVSEHLQLLAAQLPEDLRLAVLAALGIEPDARLPFYQDRISWVAARLRRDERTVRRRIDEGIRQLAQLAVAPSDGPVPPGVGPASDWHTEELRVTLVLDRAAPVAFLHRRIIADCDDLERLDLAFTVTTRLGQSSALTTGDLQIDVMFGGTLACVEMESSDRFGLVLDLPRPLHKDESHLFGLQTRIPEGGRVMQPHYVCVPDHRCDLFELRVRFDATAPPRRVWRLDGVYQRDIDDPKVVGDPVEVDKAGEIGLSFAQLRTHRAYGARWEA